MKSTSSEQELCIIVRQNFVLCKADPFADPVLEYLFAPNKVFVNRLVYAIYRGRRLMSQCPVDLCVFKEFVQKSAGFLGGLRALN